MPAKHRNVPPVKTCGYRSKRPVTVFVFSLVIDLAWAIWKERGSDLRHPATQIQTKQLRAAMCLRAWRPRYCILGSASGSRVWNLDLLDCVGWGGHQRQWKEVFVCRLSASGYRGEIPNLVLQRVRFPRSLPFFLLRRERMCHRGDAALQAA